MRINELTEIAWPSFTLVGLSATSLLIGIAPGIE